MAAILSARSTGKQANQRDRMAKDSRSKRGEARKKALLGASVRWMERRVKESKLRERKFLADFAFQTGVDKARRSWRSRSSTLWSASRVSCWRGTQAPAKASRISQRLLLFSVHSYRMAAPTTTLQALHRPIMPGPTRCRPCKDTLQLRLCLTGFGLFPVERLFSQVYRPSRQHPFQAQAPEQD
jgi:hypothetical protein